jgi:glyoxylase-like metal-dependent hydrolase (beta-lactamase superfamily II)
MTAAPDVTELVPGIHRIASPLGERPMAQWLAVGSRGALLVDTGIAGTVRDVVTPALGGLGLAPGDLTDVVISHADVDHYGGDAELRALAPGVRLRAHAADRPLIESFEAIAAERYGWYRRHGLDYPPETWAWLSEAAGADTPLDGTLEDGERIDLGGLELELLHLPGHSHGHVGLWHERSRTAVVLDAAMGRGFTTSAGARVSPPPYVDVDAYCATIARLSALRPAWLATTHFPPLEGSDASAFLDASAAFVEQLDAAVRAALGREPAPLAALLPLCDAAVGPFPQMGVELARSIGAHLEQLERSGWAERVETAGAPPAWALA